MVSFSAHLRCVKIGGCPDNRYPYRDEIKSIESLEADPLFTCICLKGGFWPNEDSSRIQMSDTLTQKFLSRSKDKLAVVLGDKPMVLAPLACK